MEEPRGTFRLTGPNIQQDEITVTREGLTVGRVPGSDVILIHTQISRRHLRIMWQGRQFWVEDLDSRNGTWLRDRRLQPHQAEPLNPGDTIRAGPYMFTFVGVQVDEPQPVPSRLPEESILQSVARVLRPPSNVPEISRIEEQAPPPSLPSLPQSGPPPADGYPVGVPRDRSTWLQYLPGIYGEHEFIGRYLLIFESLLAPIMWMRDNFTMCMDPQSAPEDWLYWIAGWFDLLIIPDLSVERLRAILDEAGWLFARRGTRAGMERLFELYFGVKPEIVESEDSPHFTMRLALGDDSLQTRTLVERLIESQKPAFAGYTLEIE
ncbi:MAG: FHA domain-containing protein [Anaerolineae bacterium]|nr:FHA domain-containing protein [Anaerolineae bacterium]